MDFRGGLLGLPFFSLRGPGSARFFRGSPGLPFFVRRCLIAVERGLSLDISSGLCRFARANTGTLSDFRLELREPCISLTISYRFLWLTILVRLEL